MLKTYTLYLRGDGFTASSFEPALSESRADLLVKVSDMLARFPACEAIDVYFGSEELFSVKQIGR